MQPRSSAGKGERFEGAMMCHGGSPVVYKCCIMLHNVLAHLAVQDMYKMLSELTKFDPGNYARLPAADTEDSIDQFQPFPKSKAVPGFSSTCSAQEKYYRSSTSSNQPDMSHSTARVNQLF